MNITSVEDKLVIVSTQIGVAVYDFDFDLHFNCRHPYAFEAEQACVLRVGPLEDYEATFSQMQEIGLRPINSPAQHIVASELASWYPLLADLTPRSEIFDSLPMADDLEQRFDWSVFIKGSRQTSKHNPDLSIARDRPQYEEVRRAYAADPILHWQKPVVREYIELMSVPGHVAGKIRPSIEFRTFWWNGKCVGCGRYWYQLSEYTCDDLDAGLAIAQEAANRLQIPFIVIDIAKTAQGRWIIIECNDAQESGYAAITPRLLWRNILELIT